MADKAPAAAPESGGNPIWWFLGIMIALFLVWLFGGGPQRYEARHPELVPTTYDPTFKGPTSTTDLIDEPTVSQ
ncbi:MAG: hypothetical protein HZA95_03680 [Candidatus Vogelbacteria bacterium]|nr:hypothetical protein [Candidatus Vogelbacteria bacterium]